MNRIHVSGLLLAFVLALGGCQRGVTDPPAGNEANRNSGSQQTQPAADPNKIGRLMENAPVRSDKAAGIDFDIWLQPNPGHEKWSEPVEVFMENKPSLIKYDPPQFKLKVGDTQKVHATILKSYSGLAIVFAYTRDGQWEPFDTTVDLGFSAKMKTNINEPIEGNTEKSLVIDFIDKDGNPAPVDSNIKLIIQTSSKLKVFDPADSLWKQNAEFPVTMQRTSANPIRIKSDAWNGDKGLISAQLSSNQGYPVHEEEIWVTVRPRWYLSLVVAMLGGLAYGGYQLLSFIVKPRNSKRKLVVTLIIGSMAGALSYFLSSWGILGFKVDTSTVEGFFLLGFLFAYTGIDIILKAAARSK